MGREKADKHQEFHDFFGFIKKLAIEGLSGLHKFIISVNSNMSAIWKGLGMGNNSAHKEIPSYCCPRKGNLLHIANSVRCTCFCSDIPDDRTDWCCYHQTMITDEVLKEKKDKLTALQNQMLYHLDTLSESTMTREDPYNNESNRNSVSDLHSIHYNPPVMTVKD